LTVTTILINKINNIHIQLPNLRAYCHRMPISEKRLAANRANAQLSRGPTSAAGKRISSRNGARKSALSSVILIDGESAARFDALLREYESEFQPTTPTERAFVENMVIARRHQARALALHSAAIDYEIRNQCVVENDDANDTPCDRAMDTIRASAGKSPHLEFLNRDQSRLDRQYIRALRGLARFRAERQKKQQNTHQLQANKGDDK
jgi:hypothetical protein